MAATEKSRWSFLAAAPAARMALEAFAEQYVLMFPPAGASSRRVERGGGIATQQ